MVPARQLPPPLLLLVLHPPLPLPQLPSVANACAEAASAAFSSWLASAAMSAGSGQSASVPRAGHTQGDDEASGERCRMQLQTKTTSRLLYCTRDSEVEAGVHKRWSGVQGQRQDMLTHMTDVEAGKVSGMSDLELTDCREKSQLIVNL